MKNTHTLTRVTKTAFDELNKIKKVTGLSHAAVMSLQLTVILTNKICLIVA